MADRTPEERERARLEREARRAGRPAPPPAAEPPPDEPNEAAPQASGDAPEPAPPPPVEGPPATGREWRREAGDPDPDPPLVRKVPPGTPRERIEGSDEPLPEPSPREAPTRRIPPPPSPPYSGDPEQPMGTKRVSAAHRVGRPHLPRRHKSTGPQTLTASAASPSGTRVLARRVAALLALVVVAVVIWFAMSLFQPFSGDGSGSVVVTIPKGAGVGEVGDILERDGVISSSFFFKLRAKLEGKDSALPSGRIAMKHDMSYAAALDALTKPRPAPKLTKLTLPEGLSREEIAPRVKDAGIEGDYVAASRASKALNPRAFGAPKGATLEGFLFPATYDLKPTATAATLVTQQLKAFRHNIAGVGFKRARSKNLTVYDVIVIASMIEREAAIAKDRPLIAAVIYNRLKQGMALHIDATLRYSLKNWTKPLKLSELNDESNPYNTGKHTGLPPGPIGNPGLASIQAAAHPAKVGYLFYVVKPCGNGAHNFSSTDAEFQADVDAYNRKREELGGKSPVTCK